jgi:hypothetical protein
MHNGSRGVRLAICTSAFCIRGAIVMQNELKMILNRFAFELQSNCNRFAIALQSLCNRFASALQTLYNRIAIANYDRHAIAPH